MMRFVTHGLRAPALALALAVLAVPAVARAQPAPLPAGWPSDQLQLGMRDDEGGADALRTSTKLGVRYHYLSGGVNTGRGWSTWTLGGGSFVPGFVADSAAHGFLPVFSYYQLRESAPGNAQGEEEGMLGNLRNRDTMRAYYADLRLFFQKAASAGRTVVLHVEPDAWGYIQRHADGGDPTTVPVQVAATGMSELQGLPDDARGFAQAIVRLRDQYAKNVLLGWHLSVWGTGEDPADSDPSDAHIDELAGRSSAFFTALKSSFDLIFAEYDDRDSGYAQVVNGDGGRSWWTDGDFARQARYLGDVSAATGKRIVLWQIPLGNRSMRAMNNSSGHYQDNRVEWLLTGPSARSHLTAYTNAGVIAFLFGPALPGATCACDAMGDGTTNPSPINGNALASLSADDDGGLFRASANAYYAGGTITLPAAKVSGGPKPPPSTTPHISVRAAAATSGVTRGSPARITVRVRSQRSTRAVVAVQFYKPGATSFTGQVAYRNQKLHKGRTVTYTVRYPVSVRARRGPWLVKVGVFDADFRTLWAWNGRAAQFTVR